MNDPLQDLLNAGAIETSPFPPNSRYYGVALAKLELPGRDAVPYVRRRFISPPDHFADLAAHTVVQGDRIDLLASRYLGDPERYWQIADANGAMDPAELTAEPGRRLRITLPEGIPGAPDA